MRPLWKGSFVIWQFTETRPYFFVRCAQFLKDLENCVDFRIARKERATSCHFAKHASNAPHVHWHTVKRRTKKNLEWPVPHGHDLVRVLGQRHGNGTREAKVRYLKVQLLVDQQVLWLDIPVYDPVCVTEPNPCDKLESEVLNQCRAQAPTLRLHVLLQIIVEIFKNQDQLVRLAHQVSKFHNIWMVELLQQRNLTDCRARDSLFLHFNLHLFQG
mmetsp:Transcript_55888/g.149048  ORF Transcript_55888/g.149048 Transcript_55888/m.149048 type:complete len:215 (+) Transcript_55888:406-1050(+)